MATDRQRYCEVGCRPTADRAATVTVECAWCGRGFEARARDVECGWGRFCTKAHALRARSSPAAQEKARHRMEAA
jgi:hypothetical protein